MKHAQAKGLQNTLSDEVSDEEVMHIELQMMPFVTTVWYWMLLG